MTIINPKSRVSILLSPYLLSLTSEGNHLKNEMREAEEEWISYFEHFYELGPRSTIVLTNTTDLPDYEELLETRAKFKEWLENQKSGFNAGRRSCSTPRWLDYDKTLIDEDASHLKPLKMLKFRRPVQAFRSSVLTENEVMEILGKRLFGLQSTLDMQQETDLSKLKPEIAKHALSQIEKTKNRIKSLNVNMKKISFIYKQHTGVSARIMSGSGRKLQIKDHEGTSFQATFSNVAVALVDKSTQIITPEAVERPKRNSNMYKIAELEGILFFITTNLISGRGYRVKMKDHKS